LQIFSIIDFFRFVRINVSLSVTFTAVIAAWIGSGGDMSAHWLPLSGIFFLACGASALNQYQERYIDGMMERTRIRPIPSGKYEKQVALLMAGFMILLGFLLIGLSYLLLTLLLGIVNIVWYNGFYTWLKKKTAFAVVPGALTGAIPVLMGWSITGNSIFHLIPLYLAFFIFMWQIPHFWLMMLKYGQEYRMAGLPVLQDNFTEPQMKRVISVWLMAASVASILLLVVVNLQSVFFLGIGVLLNLGFLAFAYYELFRNGTIRYKPLFLSVNLFMLLVLFMISILGTFK
jgi:heme o synthase